jgi:hypothetical protein
VSERTAAERFVCSDASVDRVEAVVATASQVRAWLLVEVHGAWGADAIEDSALGPHVPDGWKAELKLRGIRPICIRPAERREAGEVRMFFVVAARPGRNAGATWTRTVPTLSAVRYAVDDLAIGHVPDGWTPHDERVVLVCTNGKHDQCCANRGRPVVRHLRETPWADRAWECSHIGGDRFAANLVVLPDSLYFGRMEPAEAETILDEVAAGRLPLDWYRGRSTLSFVEQAAEQALRTGFEVVGVDDVVIDRGASEPGRIRAHVTGMGAFDVAMERTNVRLDEALTCHGPGNQVVPVHTATAITEARADP